MHPDLADQIMQKRFSAQSSGTGSPDAGMILLRIASICAFPSSKPLLHGVQSPSIASDFLAATLRVPAPAQQKVTVEHVHVHSGGQAVVGVVETPGGGDHAKVEGQPHAKQIAHAPQSPLWGADKERDAVPVAGNAERPLPDARRTIVGRSEG